MNETLHFWLLVISPAKTFTTGTYWIYASQKDSVVFSHSEFATNKVAQMASYLLYICIMLLKPPRILIARPKEAVDICQQEIAHENRRLLGIWTRHLIQWTLLPNEEQLRTFSNEHAEKLNIKTVDATVKSNNYLIGMLCFWRFLLKIQRTFTGSALSVKKRPYTRKLQHFLFKRDYCAMRTFWYYRAILRKEAESNSSCGNCNAKTRWPSRTQFPFRWESGNQQH